MAIRTVSAGDFCLGIGEHFLTGGFHQTNHFTATFLASPHQHFRADRTRSILEEMQSEAGPFGSWLFKSFSIVSYNDAWGPIPGSAMNGDISGIAMPDSISERFLDDAVKVNGGFLFKKESVVAPHGTTYPREILGAMGQIGQRQQQAAVLELNRIQCLGEIAGRANTVGKEGFKLRGLRRFGVGLRRELVGEQLREHGHAHELLSEVIVKILPEPR
ncbi:MAG: hypothetical protein V4710_18630, partial [Verrucomicrobiota bacterium]